MEGDDERGDDEEHGLKQLIFGGWRSETTASRVLRAASYVHSATVVQRGVRAWQARTMVSRLKRRALVSAAEAIQAAFRGRMARVRVKARRRHEERRARRKSVVSVGATHITVGYKEFGGGGYVEQAAREHTSATAVPPLRVPPPRASGGGRSMRRSVSKPSDVVSERVVVEAAAGAGLTRSASRPNVGAKEGGGSISVAKRQLLV